MSDKVGFPLGDECFSLPEWITSDDIVEDELETDGDVGSSSTIEKRKISSLSSFARDDLSPLEALASDVSANILQHLSVQEIAIVVSAVSKSMYQAARNPDLWKLKFQTRWNFAGHRQAHQKKDDDCSLDWFHAYQQAYLNTHDLWITHWNCVDPTDGLSPGRCCIQLDSCTSTVEGEKGCRHSQMRLCPCCRYHPSIQEPDDIDLSSSISTPAQAIHLATRLRLQQFSTTLPTAKYCPNRANRAFSISSTLQRPLETQQYLSKSLNFLTDLLFFEVHDGKQELRALECLFPAHDRNTLEGSETALHSWHLCHFSNPDYNRPLVWRASIQRKDCFTIYPSEGYLQPGESKVVVFGVKPLASFLAHATQQLNAHREGVDEFLANVYTEEAHLPPAPFLIHYHFAAVIPCRRADEDTLSHRLHEMPPAANVPAMHLRNQTMVRSANYSSSKADSPWHRWAQPQQPVRTMYLSAHVNVNHSLNEFRRSTLVPFEARDRRTHAFCAPQLQEGHPKVWHQLENLGLEQEDSVAGQAYRTEAPCQQCGQSWGARVEELGQAFVMAKLESEMEKQIRDESLRRTHALLKQLLQSTPIANSHTWGERHHQVCVEVHQMLVDYRAAPWPTRRQREVLLRWEAATDELCRGYNAMVEPTKEYFAVPWRHAGVYRNVLCTDSLYSEETSKLLDGNETIVWKDEPHYLEAFAHLAHSPGRFCLGPQEDPNHLQPREHSRFGRRQIGCVSDMFLDDPVCGLQAALCVVSDPRSLMIHGIWDRVPYPGSLIRRPKIQCFPPIPNNLMSADPFCALQASQEVLRLPQPAEYYDLQNSLDVESLRLVESRLTQRTAVEQSTNVRLPVSLSLYLANVPPPGVGRFALSVATEDETGRVHIRELALPESGDDTALDITEADVTLVERRGEPGHGELMREDWNMPLAHIPGRAGPRILNLLWVLSTNIGWTMDDNQDAATVYVDRRILIGAQWLSISLMVAPLFWTLLARSVQWIPATPVDYSLEDLPFQVENPLRFLTERECGYVAVVLLLSWMSLGRWIERYTSRDFFRAMLEHMPSVDKSSDGILRRIHTKICIWLQRQWDSVCPLFLQRMVFVPKWNRRSRNDLLKHVAYYRSRFRSEVPAAFEAVAGRGLVFFWEQDRQFLGEVSPSRKLVTGIVVALASFSASSPHFYLNLLSVFCSSISLGLSMSLQSMETGRAGVTVSTTGSIIKALSLVTIIILGFLVGQLVGSSGGVLFLAEFVVTSMNLLLGGASHISGSGMESWGTFFCLSSTAFWGYLFGRVAIMEGLRQKKSGFSSTMLCISLVVLGCLWMIAVFVWQWEGPVQLMVVRPLFQRDFRKDWIRKYEPGELQ